MFMEGIFKFPLESMLPKTPPRIAPGMGLPPFQGIRMFDKFPERTAAPALYPTLEPSTVPICAPVCPSTAPPTAAPIRAPVCPAAVITVFERVFWKLWRGIGDPRALRAPALAVLETEVDMSETARLKVFGEGFENICESLAVSNTEGIADAVRKQRNGSEQPSSARAQPTFEFTPILKTISCRGISYRPCDSPPYWGYEALLPKCDFRPKYVGDLRGRLDIGTQYPLIPTGSYSKW
jgi:hypothetical protein